MEKPRKEHYQMATDYGYTLAIYDYIGDMEKYCTFLETENKALALLSVGKSVKEKYTPTFEEWIKTFKQVDGKLYQLDNYRTYCIAAMHQEYRLTFKVEP